MGIFGRVRCLDAHIWRSDGTKTEGGNVAPRRELKLSLRPNCGEGVEQERRRVRTEAENLQQGRLGREEELALEKEKGEQEGGQYEVVDAKGGAFSRGREGISWTNIPE